jgi:transcription antitermination factor NusG
MSWFYPVMGSQRCRCRELSTQGKEAEMAGRKQWYIVKVRPTFESIVVRELRKREFEAFLTENNPRLAHRANAYELLLPEVVFCRFDLSEKDRVLSVPGVMCILGTPDPFPVDDGKISALRTAISSDATRRVVRPRKEADRVRVMTGPLRGTAGDLLEINGRQQLGIRFQLLDQVFAFDIQGSSIRTIRQSAVRKPDVRVSTGYRRRSPISRDK